MLGVFILALTFGMMIILPPIVYAKRTKLFENLALVPDGTRLALSRQSLKAIRRFNLLMIIYLAIIMASLYTAAHLLYAARSPAVHTSMVSIPEE